MATTPVARRNAEARAKQAETKDTDDIFDEIGRQSSTIKVSEIIEGVAKELGSEEIAKLLAKQIKKGSVRDSKMFLQELLRIVNTHEKKTAAITENEISRLEDDQIEALLQHEYGLQPKDQSKRVAKSFHDGILARTRPMNRKKPESDPAESDA